MNWTMKPGYKGKNALWKQSLSTAGSDRVRFWKEKKKEKDMLAEIGDIQPDTVVFMIRCGVMASRWL